MFGFIFFKESKQTLLSFCFLVILSFSILNGLRHFGFRPIHFTEEQRLKPPLKNMKLVTFGFHEISADFLWIRFIQNLDHCLEKKKLEDNDCELGWGYQMLSSIHDLAPKFRIPMAVGPMSLSVLSDDYKGADILYRKAIQSFPNDWPILYRAGYHFMEEGQDLALAGELFERAHKNGGPHWLPSLAARLFEKEGRKELALSILLEYRKSIENPVLIKKINERIERLDL